MNILFAETPKKLRTDRNLSQKDLAERMFVTRSTVARWENGSRLPDAIMIFRLSKCLDVDINPLLSAAAESDDAPNVIMVDDRKIFLSAALPVLEEAMPNAMITGFTKPSEAIEYAKSNRIAVAFLDIEMGKTNGLDLCRELITLNPRANVVYLTFNLCNVRHYIIQPNRQICAPAKGNRKSTGKYYGASNAPAFYLQRYDEHLLSLRKGRKKSPASYAGLYRVS